MNSYLISIKITSEHASAWQSSVEGITEALFELGEEEGFSSSVRMLQAMKQSWKRVIVKLSHRTLYIFSEEMKLKAQHDLTYDRCQHAFDAPVHERVYSLLNI